MAFIDPTLRLEGLEPYEEKGMPAYKVTRDLLRRTIEGLSRDPELGFDALLDLTVVEFSDHLEGVYHLFRFDDGAEIAIAAEIPIDDLWLPTISDIMPAANIMESEAWEFFGVDYKGHPGLRHLLLPDDFIGFPLRKSYKNHTRD